jgi:thiamine-monophosphate kinase
MDLSDGLSTDLNRLCEASGVGARLDVRCIPAVNVPPPLAHRLRTTALDFALHGGEDYELLFTLPKSRAARLPRRLGGVALTAIGEITRARAIQLVDGSGRRRLLRPQGWDHFRRG